MFILYFNTYGTNSIQFPREESSHEVEVYVYTVNTL